MLKDEAWDGVNHARRYVRTENQEQAYLSFYAKIDRRVKRAVIAMDPANEAVNGDLVAFLSDNSDHLSSRPCRGAWSRTARSLRPLQASPNATPTPRPDANAGIARTIFASQTAPRRAIGLATNAVARPSEGGMRMRSSG